jgi:type I restriction enzyme S subunit
VPEEEQPFEIPEAWVWVKLSAICEYIRAGGDKPKNFSKTKTDIYKIPVIANGVSNEGIIGYTDIETEKENTVTVSGRGTIGFSLFRDYPYCPIVRLIVLAPSKIILPLFFKLAFDNFYEEGVGTSIPQLTVPMIKNKAIPLPPLAEQKEIVRRLEVIFEKEEHTKELCNQTEKIELIKKTILARAFRGFL